ncbi:MAG TPA: 30S ribosomal protein S8 [Patescibacteria group bacterium]|nr:30S ribosomal protein S8 [Patescibacteria group bacterium]
MYLVADFIIRLKNAAMARRRQVVLPYSKLNKAIGQVLVKQGILGSLKEESKDAKKTLVATINFEKRLAVFTDVTVISKPSLRVYASSDDKVGLVGRGLGITIVSTNQGVMTGREAVKKGVGGEVLFKIW